ncbi:MAG: cation diffusion facilitator family transporter [Bacteroidales bacterium]|jgi:cation diffusion facilitator family transporter|nr:cation diffusion facilitator family transporter [Bacteroidales bacterium]MDG1900783.1 cation diffusion facilitator family transporter [Bacteroidales bacterium]
MANLSRKEKIIKASWIAIIANSMLSILKITVGIVSGSFAVIADGIDSAGDILTSLITLFTAHIINKPPDIKYPYGYNKADTIATKLLAFIIFFAGAQLAISSFDRLFSPHPNIIPNTIAIYVIVVSIIGKYGLSIYLLKTGKKIDSQMLLANGKNMFNDVIISFSVLTGLAFTFIFKMPILDLITACIVSFYIMFVAFRIFLQSNRDLMDGVDNEDIYRKIIAAAKSVDGVYRPHRIRARKMAHLYIIALDVEIDGIKSLDNAHKLCHEVENKIKIALPNTYDVLVHPEPIGTHDPKEAYGISEELLNK